MEKIKKNKKTIIIALLILIVIAGVIVTLTVGLNFDLRYQDTKKIELYIGKTFEYNDIKNIVNEVMPGQDNIIQKVEVFEDSVSIIAKDITDEQKTNIINKVNEKYGTEISADSTEITKIPNTRGIDIVKPYIMPFTIATLIILAYMAVRYHKLGSIKTIIITALTCVIAQIGLLSIMAITRIPIGRFTIPIVLLVYLLTLVGLTTNFENKLKLKIEKENKNKK